MNQAIRRAGSHTTWLLLLVLVLTGGAGKAHAEVVNLYKNVQDDFIDQTRVGDIVGQTDRRQIAMAFTTGDNAGGYTLSAVKIWVHFENKTALADPPVPGAMPKVSIYTNASGSPGTSKYVLTTPTFTYSGTTYDDYGHTTFDFNAPASATLDASTTYFVVFEDTGTDGSWTLALQHITNTLETVASGWSAGTRYLRKDGTGTWGATGLFRKIYMEISGTIDAEVDTTAPTLDTATVDGTSLVLTYDEALDEDSEPATSAYSVSVGGVSAAPSSVDVTGTKVTLTLGTAVTAGQTVTVTYTVPSSNPVQDAAGNDAAALTNQSVTNNTNAPPAFTNDTETRTIDETVAAATVQTAANIGAAITASDDDNDTLTYTLEGTDAGKFSIVSSTGQLQTKVGQSYDYEANTSYSVTIKADDRKGGTDTVAVTINVTNNLTEKPLTPAAPIMTPTSGSTTSLDVRWTAPTNTGRPTITDYDLRYRKGNTGGWTTGPQNVTGTSTSITGLDANSAYQVQVLATNADGNSDWSSPGSGRTANNAPEFSSSTTTRSLAETVGDAVVQTAANIGAAVEASDDDNNDTLEYSLEGTDAAKFTIVSSSGQIQTKVGESYDYEADTSYSVTVKASDGTASDTISVTINITNATEKPLTPVAPTVTTTSGSTTSVDVTWTAPSNTGRPAITVYDLQYRKGTSGSWITGPQNVTGTSSTISGLDGNSLYQVRMLATNADGDSDWSSPGEGSTANNGPEFSSTTTTRTLAETIGDATVQTAADIGAAITATDPDMDPLTYTLEGTDKDKFGIVPSSGQIQTKGGESYDYEANTSYSVTVKATDTGGGSAVITVTINVTNNDTEIPLTPAAPTVVATPGVTMSLDVTWTAPLNTGRPAITSYDLQYRKGDSGDFTEGPQDVTGTSAMISGLDGNATYEVQVRATNADGDSDWSPTGGGDTANTPPEFSDDSTVRGFAETLGDATVQTPADIGAVVTATDPDGDALTYTLEGTDADKFTIEPSTGQLQTKVGESYNYEATTSYEVIVKADDSKGGTDTIEVTINVTNITEFVSAYAVPGGVSVVMEFIETLSTTPPPVSAITVMVDGETAVVQSVTTGGNIAQALPANRIRQGQTVTVSYTDPGPGDDVNAIQSQSGIDAHSFTDQPVDNQSTLTPHRPRPPTGLMVAADGSTRIDLSWTAPVDNGGRVITGYRIQVSPDGRALGLNVIWNDVVSNTNNKDTTYTHTGLSPGTTGYYRVWAINSAGTSEGSNIVTETTPTTDGTPSAPLRLRASAAHRQIDLSWEPPGYEGEVGVEVTGYKIQRSADGVTSWTDLVADTGTTATTYEDTNLDFATKWHYRVSAINSAGAGQTATVSATTLNRNTPSALQSLRTILSPTQVTLEWDPLEDDGGSTIVYYEYRLINESGPAGWVLALLVHERSIYEHVIRELNPGQTYTIEFRAVNANGQGEVIEVTVTLPLVASTPSGQDDMEMVPDDMEMVPDDMEMVPDDMEMVPNIPPVVAIPLVDQSAMVDAPFFYVMAEGTFTDADGDPLTYSASLSDGTALPTWLTFEPDTGTFSGMPGPNDTGQVLVKVTASDGRASVSDEFILTVDIMDEPVLSSWLSRFGRTVGSHVTDAIGQRLRTRSGSHLKVAGHQLTLDETDSGEPPNDINREPGLIGQAGSDDLHFASDLQTVSNEGTGSRLFTKEGSWDSREDQTQTLDDLRGLLAGSAFQLALNPDDVGASPRLTAWGRVAGTQFDGHEGDIALDGDVLTATLGMDRTHGQWLAGIALSHSLSDGGYSMEGTRLQGDLENDLTSIHPYLRYAVNDDLDVWGVLGYGEGRLSVKSEAGDTLRTDTRLRMAAFGARGTLLETSDVKGIELATQTELMFTQMSSDGISELPSTNAYAHRLRVILEGSRAFTWDDGQQLTPSLELGFRNDWGSAESGFGLELGGRMSYSDPSSRLTLEGAVRGLLAHEASHYREWGASGTLRLEPEASGQGLSVALASNWGRAASGVDGMWSRQTLSGLAPQDQDSVQNGNLDVQLGYGFWMPAMEGLVTPFTQLTASNAGESRSRTGLMFFRRNTGVGPIRMEFAGERIESDAGQPEHRIGLQVQLQLARSNSPFLVDRSRDQTKSRRR